MTFAEANSSDMPTRPGAVAAAPPVAPSLLLPPPPALQPGDTLGQYRILDRLGAGGMGEVFRAVHLTMDRVVALKVLPPQRMSEERARLRFQREVRSAARLSHPNIVTAYDAHEDRGLCYLVMEYVEGVDLSRCAAAFGTPPLPVACEIIRQAALGLQHAHEKGMVHRDIKPANLMVTRASATANTLLAAPSWPVPLVVKILDFGLARLQFTEEVSPDGEKPVTREGVVVGTPEFMSPEQATDSRRVDIRSDIYSLGCTLYFLLAGHSPFLSNSAFETLARHLKEPPPPLTAARPEIHPALAALVNRMLAKRPEDRFQTPAELAKALKPWARYAVAPSSSSSSARTIDMSGLETPPGMQNPLRENARRLLDHPPVVSNPLPSLATWTAIVLIVALLTLLTLLVWQKIRPPENAHEGPSVPVIPSQQKNFD
jgi:serine/threonine protein kinase